MYNTDKSRWVHMRGNCTPRYLLPSSVLKKRCLWGSEKGSIIIQFAVITLGVMSKICKTVDKVTTIAYMVRSQIMNLWKKLQVSPTPGYHFHHYIAMPAAYKRKNKSGMVFDSDSFDVGIHSMASACMSAQKCHFNEYEEIPLGQCGAISGGLRNRWRETLRIRIEDDLDRFIGSAYQLSLYSRSANGIVFTSTLRSRSRPCWVHNNRRKMCHKMGTASSILQNYCS